ncbi:MAG TPA: branched-chain amino acid ABC transporter permease [Dehalococcoidia bacterium]|nr:branched-chain amino acid ABC transporter permease [Dehalococcoidia bacterium]
MNISGIISSKWFSPVVAGIILVVLAALPAYAAGYTPILFTTIYMYIILSVSWALFSGPTGYMSLATAAFFGVGIYIASLLGEILPLPLFILAGGLASAVVALLVGALTLRLKGIYFAIFTFGLVMLIAQLLLFFELHVTGTRGRFVIVIDYTTIYYTMLVIFVLLMLTVFLLRRSKWGLALQSIGENEEAAAHIGINVTTVKVLFFALSAFFIGMAGATIATRWTYIDPIIAFDPDISFLPVLMAIFGGMTRSYGPIIGAIIFSYLQEILITKFAELYMLIFGIILVISILYLPNGIVGSIQRLWQKLEKRRYANA